MLNIDSSLDRIIGHHHADTNIPYADELRNLVTLLGAQSGNGITLEQVRMFDNQLIYVPLALLYIHTLKVIYMYISMKCVVWLYLTQPVGDLWCTHHCVVIMVQEL